MSRTRKRSDDQPRNVPRGKKPANSKKETTREISAKEALMIAEAENAEKIRTDGEQVW